MGGQDLTAMSCVLRTLLLGLLFLSGFTLSEPAQAADLPIVSNSNLAGFPFNDQPMLLPVERNFQMAMITASGDIGRSCGKIEAYGWRVNSNEQFRVNRIFNDTVNGLRDLGYRVEAQTPSSVSRDVTLVTADRPDKHFLMMWSAGDIGLVMSMCESSGTLHNRNATAYDLPAPQFSSQSQAVVTSALEKPGSEAIAPIAEEFSPAGDWIGSYTCHQGYTGGTLHITHVDGKNFDGVFRFYPTPKNSSVPAGSYNVFGQYDMQSKRVLINPGQWIERPRHFYNTIIVGTFDTDKRTFSGYFQGVTGCTSFEASYAGSDLNVAGKHLVKPTKKAKSKKKTVAAKKIAMPANALATPLSIVPDQAPPGLLLPSPTSPSHDLTSKKSSSNEPAGDKPIVLAAASGQWYTPTVPQVQSAPTYNTQAPQVAPAPVVQPVTPRIVTTPEVPQVGNYNTVPQQVPSAPQAPQPSYYTTTVPQVPQAPQVPQPSYYNTTVPQVPQAPTITIGNGAR